MTRIQAINWLEACAHYFEKLPLNGEDMTFQSNVHNAASARSIADLLRENDEDES